MDVLLLFVQSYRVCLMYRVNVERLRARMSDGPACLFLYSSFSLLSVHRL